jgi:hypothetical protein
MEWWEYYQLLIPLPNTRQMQLDMNAVYFLEVRREDWRLRLVDLPLDFFLERL